MNNLELNQAVEALNNAKADVKGFTKTVKNINANVEIFKVSCTTGEGVQAWAKWLAARMKRS